VDELDKPEKVAPGEALVKDGKVVYQQPAAAKDAPK